MRGAWRRNSTLVFSKSSGLAKVVIGPSVGCSRSADEIVLGVDDRHLDFRASVLLRRADNSLAITTAVRCHNLLGRLYLAAILPFHILIAADVLRRLRRRF